MISHGKNKTKKSKQHTTCLLKVSEISLQAHLLNYTRPQSFILVRAHVLVPILRVDAYGLQFSSHPFGLNPQNLHHSWK